MSRERAIRREGAFVDEDGFLFIGSQKTARLVVGPGGERFVQFVDKDSRRSERLGSRLVHVDWQNLVAMVEGTFARLRPNRP